MTNDKRLIDEVKGKIQKTKLINKIKEIFIKKKQYNNLTKVNNIKVMIYLN